MGNKVYCHTEYVVNESITFEKGKYYDVFDMKSAKKTANAAEELKNDTTYIFLKMDSGLMGTDFITGFNTLKDFNVFFYTIKQMRMRKLRKLKRYGK